MRWVYDMYRYLYKCFHPESYRVYRRTRVVSSEGHHLTAGGEANSVDIVVSNGAEDRGGGNRVTQLALQIKPWSTHLH